MTVALPITDIVIPPQVDYLGPDANDSQIIDAIESQRTSFRLPRNNFDKERFIGLFRTLISKPLSKKLVLELANCGKTIRFHNSSQRNNFIWRKFQSPFFSARQVNINLQNLNKNPSIAVVVARTIEGFNWGWRRGPFTAEFNPVHITLAHELIHALHSVNGNWLAGKPASDKRYTNLEEENTIKGVQGYKDYTENDIRAEFGMRKRHFHVGVRRRSHFQRGGWV